SLVVPDIAIASPIPENVPLNVETLALCFATLSAPPLASIALATIALTSLSASAARAGEVPAISRAAKTPGNASRNIGDPLERNRVRANPYALFAARRAAFRPAHTA